MAIYNGVDDSCEVQRRGGLGWVNQERHGNQHTRESGLSPMLKRGANKHIDCKKEVSAFTMEWIRQPRLASVQERHCHMPGWVREW